MIFVRILIRVSYALIIVLGGSVVFLQASSWRTRQSTEPAFSFSDALWGGVQNGLVFVEIPIADRFYKAAKTHAEKWQPFFDRALRSGWRYSPGKSLYWGTPVDKKFLDQTVIAEATNFKLGMTLDVRTPEQRVSVRVSNYAVHCDDGAGECVLLAVATPTEPLLDTRFLVAARSVPGCDNSCKRNSVNIGATLRKRIRDSVVAKLGLKHPSDSIPRFARERIQIVSGSFTKVQAQQYAVYINLYDEGEPGGGNWATVLMDADLSILAVLDQNEHLHVIPEHAGDVNRDGLDEIWVDVSGSEGGSSGLLYIEKRSPLRYGRITGLYKGL